MELGDLKGCHFGIDSSEKELRYIEQLLKAVTGLTVRAEYSGEWSHKHSGRQPDKKSVYNDYLIDCRLNDGTAYQLMYLRGNNGKYIVITGIKKGGKRS
ncbi:MAG: hypothetical protein Q4G33_07885 [bacterium]|nr:hypothetical protein [bacterium]